jgi:hypothetical protein
MTIPRLNNNSNTFRINDFKDSRGDLLCQSFLELMIIQRVSEKKKVSPVTVLQIFLQFLVTY